MEESIVIREIRREDAQAIEYIRVAISQQDADVSFIRLVEQHFEIGNVKTSLVAEINDKVVGYMISSILYAGFGIRKSAWIMAMGVHPSFMGRGVGLKMASRLCDIYREKDVKSIYSSVLWDSIDLLSFFKKLGFTRSEFINLKKEL